jgi:hypothetical protein
MRTNSGLGTMRSGNIQHRYDVHDETPFFGPEEAHEEDEADRRLNRNRIRALRAKPNGMNTKVTMRRRGRKVEE